MPTIEQRNQRYGRYVDAVTPRTNTLKSLFSAFWVGGLTCMVGQGFFDTFKAIFPRLSTDLITSISSMLLITLAILFTGFGFYDVIGRKGGAGSFLPITGFANAMASSSMEFKTEGLIMGTSAKMFTIVGPVLVNGVVWSSVAGLINLLINRG